VRIFEGFLGVFQDAHSSKRLRIFESRAHLRQGLGPDFGELSRAALGAIFASRRAGTGIGLDRVAFDRLHWFSFTASFSVFGHQDGRRSADFGDLKSKICVIGEICGSLSLTRITPIPRIRQNVDPALISVS
jgi:hypothetical protein